MRSKVWFVLSLLALAAALIQPAIAAKPGLKCRADGTFKVVMFSDVQDGPRLDPRATALMEKILDTEKPDMVVIGGDCISGGLCKTRDEVKQAISCVAYPMEKRQIPWAIVFGNHDQEHFANTKMDKEEVLKVYQSYTCNLNVRGDKKIHGVGNTDMLIQDSSGKSPVFCLWLIDSNAYAPQNIGGYDWIHADQVNWYYQTSLNLETKYGHKIPGIMFFHIPILQFGEMTSKGKFTGDRYEPDAPAKLDGGLFAAVLERGDVKGIFCGHEHVNNYVGEWMGVKLGYDSSIGYASYNLPDSDPRSAHTRGGRVFVISQSDPWNFKTWMRFIDGSVQ